VQLRRKADHFIFTVECTAVTAPEVIVREAISALKDKASKFIGIAKEKEGAGI